MVEDQDTGVTEQSEVSVAEEQTAGVDAQVAAEEVQTQSETPEDKNWSAFRESAREQKEEIKSLRAELASFRQTPAKVQQQMDSFEQDMDDIPTKADVANYIARKEKILEQKMAEMSVMSKHPDAHGIIEKYGKQLPDAVKQAIASAPNPWEAAYFACKNSEAHYKDSLTDAQHGNAKKAVENAKKPGSASAVGSSGALSKASLYESMSDAEIVAISNKYKMGG